MSSETGSTSSTVKDDVLADPRGGWPSIPTDQIPITTVLISSLVLSGSPRLTGEDPKHTRLLAEANATLPPIAVHYPTMRVIDGVHRVRAALLRGKDTIEARLYDCSEDSAFVVGVEANTAHGLPLSLADRKSAAARIIVTHPTWSDRAVAASVGLSDKTVSGIRECSTSEVPQSNVRVGRDGRVRPVNSASARQRAAELIKARPDMGLREIAREAGLSLGTASDVRERIGRDEDPVPQKYQNSDRSPTSTSTKARSRSTAPSKEDAPERDRRASSILKILENDPSVKLNEPGRRMLRWLRRYMIGSKDCETMTDAVPAHCTNMVAELARGCADSWSRFAGELEQRADAVTETEA